MIGKFYKNQVFDELQWSSIYQKTIKMWRKEIYINKGIFTHDNVEMDLFFSENSFQHTRIYLTALASPAEEGAMLN